MLYPDAWKGTIPPELKQVAESKGTLQLNVATDLSLEFLAHLVFPAWLHTPKMKVLDAACGTGEAVTLQAVRYPHTAITAMEEDAEALGSAKAYVTELGVTNVTFEPVEEERYHVIESTRPLNQIGDPEAFLKKWGQKLAQPGLLTVAADAVFAGPRFDALQAAAVCLRTKDSAKEELQAAVTDILAVLDAPAEPGLWNIPDLAQLTAAAGLRIAALLHPYNYEPVRFIDSPAMREITANLSTVEKAWLTEVLLGQSTKHHLVLIPAETAENMPLITDEEASGYIPHPSPYVKIEQAGAGRYRFVLNRQHLLLHPALSVEDIEAPADMVRVFQGINGMATFEQLHRRFLPLPWDVFWHFMNLLAENGMITLHREAQDYGTV